MLAHASGCVQELKKKNTASEKGGRHECRASTSEARALACHLPSEFRYRVESYGWWDKNEGVRMAYKRTAATGMWLQCLNLLCEDEDEDVNRWAHISISKLRLNWIETLVFHVNRHLYVYIPDKLWKGFYICSSSESIALSVSSGTKASPHCTWLQSLFRREEGMVVYNNLSNM